ncbi:MAG: DegV family protein [Clostridiales bacterium]|nr:DegV family protein [Clostridiales bacterium]
MPENSYVFMTDSDSDLPFRYVDELDLTMVYMPYILDGKEYLDDLGRYGKQKEYFDNMRAGSAPVTSLLPTPVYVDYFEPCFREGRDILFISFSSQLSSTINNIFAAREELLAKYPDRKMIVVDTLSISAPQTLLILGAYELYRQGKPMEEVAAWVEENKMHAQAWFTVDDLKYLRRGGRISAMAATLGTALDLKPIIILNKGGKLVSADKVRGRKAALRYIADKTAENILNPESQTLILMHADAPEDVARLEALIRERVPSIHAIETIYVGPVIGAHCGPGTIAACFMGKERPI